MVRCKECAKKLADRKGLSCHVKVAHNAQFIDYVIKHELGGSRPTCACGCGGQTSFFGGKFMMYLDHHQPGSKQTREARRKISMGLTGKKQTASSNRKRSAAMLAYHAQHPELAQRTSSYMKGRTVTQETKDRIGSTRSAMLASGELTINRDAISQTIAQLYVDGGFAWAKGTYVSTKTCRKCYYRSSWELSLMQQLDTDDDVLDWESEFTTIPYQFEGIHHVYIPDFRVVRNGVTQIIEVKPVSLRIIPKNVAKRQAAQRYCAERGWAYVEWEPAS